MSSFGIYGAFFRALSFRPLDTATGFGALETSSYGALVVGLLFAALAETLAVHLAMAYYLGPEWVGLHVVIGAIHLSGIMWIIGDWRLMKEGAHRVGEDALEIGLGQRWTGRVALDTIDEVRVGEVSTPDILGGEKRPDHIIAVTPFDAPNLTLVLREPTTLQTYFGIERSGTEVQVFVDDPAGLRDALAPAPRQG